MGRLKVKQKVVMIALSVGIFFSSAVASNGVKVNADSNARVQTAISWAKNTSFENMDKDVLDSLTYDDLRMLGTFLSNFYVPFSTELGKSADESEVKEKMIDVLVNQCNFDREVAETLVPLIWQMSLDTAKPLNIGTLDDNGEVGAWGSADVTPRMLQDNSSDSSSIFQSILSFLEMLSLQKVAGDLIVGSSTTFSLRKDEKFYKDGGLSGSYYNFLACWSGGVTDTNMNNLTCKPFVDRNSCLYWVDDNNNKRVVFDNNTESGDDYGLDGLNVLGNNISFSPSSLAYVLLNDTLNYEAGVGSSLFSVSEDEFLSMSTAERENAFISNSQMYVDCFGNIILSFGSKQYIMYPACTNPYAWYNAEEDGLDSDKPASAGKSLNLINTFFIGEANEGNIKRGIKTDNTLDWSVNINTSDGSLAKLDYFRLWKGGGNNESNQLVDKYVFDDEAVNEVKSFLRQGGIAYSSDGRYDNKVNYPDWGTYTASFESVGGDYSLVSSSKVSGGLSCFEDFCLIDSLGAFQSDSSGDNKTIKSSNLFLEDGQSIMGGFSKASSFEDYITDNNIITLSGLSLKPYIVSIYLSYIYAYYDTSSGEDRLVSWAFNKNGFPAITDNIDWGDLEINPNKVQDEVLSMAYYFMHPEEGKDFVATWFKNKVGAILGGWHEDMAGTGTGVNSTGSTKYAGFSGYVTIPNLDDLSWTEWLVQKYNSLVVYMIIIIGIILCIYAIAGVLTRERALIGVVVFALCAYLPPFLIDTTINTSNMICDGIYSSKFTYWALVQHQQYASSIESAIDSGNEQDYLSTLFRTQAENGADEYAVVSLKWQCPKKDNYMKNVQEEITSISNSGMFRMIAPLMADTLSGEDYLDAADSMYLYRSYTDIGTYANKVYEDSSKIGTIANGNVQSVKVGGKDGKTLSDLYLKYTKEPEPNGVTNLNGAMLKGFNLNTVKEGLEKGGISPYRRFYAPIVSDRVAEAINKGIPNNEDYSFREGAFRDSLAGIPEYNFDVAFSDFGKKAGLITDDKDTFTYGMFTESPFYYLSFNLADQKSALDLYNYKDLFLMENGSYFYNNVDNAGSGFGELRDYTDMRSLFTVVIPYLKAANDVVVDWDTVNGLFAYEDIDLEYNGDGEIIVPEYIKKAGKDSELYYKYWHNANVAQLLNMYTPWVDLMYSCSYADPQTIYVAGERFTVSDPLNPSSYYKTDVEGNIVAGREMVFSPSEMAYYGLTESDLTTVESNIMKMQKNTYKSMLQLIDYYNFKNSVINTAGAMIQTFEFNKVFSQRSIVNGDHILYPQSFELKNFSYDAYLRLILSASTGESLADTQTGNLYRTVIDNSSVLTGVLFILTDLLAVYAIPSLKLFFILALFALSVLMIVASVLKVETNVFKTLWSGLVSPLFKFLLISVGMAFVVSLFMSNGNTSVTGRGGYVISLGDPAIVLGFMILINAVALVLYFLVAKKVVVDGIRQTKAIGLSIGGAVSGLASNVVDSVSKGRGSVESDGISAGSTRSPKSRGVSNTRPKAAKTKVNGGRTSRAEKRAGRLDNSLNELSALENGFSNKYDRKLQKFESKENFHYAKLQRKMDKQDYWRDVSKNSKLGAVKKFADLRDKHLESGMIKKDKAFENKYHTKGAKGYNKLEKWRKNSAWSQAKMGKAISKRTQKVSKRAAKAMRFNIKR